LAEAVNAAKYDDTVPAPTRRNQPMKKAKEGGEVCDSEMAMDE
jgi:hypothetical protein